MCVQINTSSEKEHHVQANNIIECSCSTQQRAEKATILSPAIPAAAAIFNYTAYLANLYIFIKRQRMCEYCSCRCGVGSDDGGEGGGGANVSRANTEPRTDAFLRGKYPFSQHYVDM